MSTQSWDPERYRDNAAFVAHYGRDVVDLLAPQHSERILDIGCGDGRLSLEIAESGAVVRGIDQSTAQIAAARELGVDADVLDVLALNDNAAYDAVFSNAALHWVKDARGAAHAIYHALKPGGRFVAEMGGGDNVKCIGAALIQALQTRGIDANALWPWYFPTVEAHSAVLQEAGFVVESIQLIDRPTPLPGAMAGWLETFAESFLHGVDESERATLIAEVEATLAPQLRDENGNWTADYVRLRFKAWKPESPAT